MAYQLFIGFTGEGSTDSRFLKEIIEKTFTAQAYGCRPDVVIEVVYTVKSISGTFVERMMDASKKSHNLGINVLCIHADADNRSNSYVLTHKFAPLLKELSEQDDSDCCKVIVPLIPIQMTEAWMLADKKLFQIQIKGTNLTLVELGIDRHPESYADPKIVIENALRIAQSGKTKRRRNDLTISDLYEEMGQLISLSSLRSLPSFRHFEDGVISAMTQLGIR